MFRPRRKHVLRLWPRIKQTSCARSYIAIKAEPLRILFCGADEFSIKSLEALHHEQDTDDQFIESIDVVCRPPKRTGRGLKILRHAPIKATAKQLGLPVHEIDTFRNWETPFHHGGRHPNLIVAVSFGLFIPKRILDSAQFGGVNVHPSLLPDLRGPAPIQHAVIKDRQKVGVTVQTLNDEKFDHGQILAQTLYERSLPAPTFLNGQAGLIAKTLSQTLAHIGAATLVKTLKERLFLPHPDRNAPQYILNGQQLHQLANGEPWPPEPYMSSPEHAPKITTADRQIDWSTFDWRELCLRHGALGPLWDDTTYRQCHAEAVSKRIIFQELEPLDVDLLSMGSTDLLDLEHRLRQPGRPSLFLKADVGSGSSQITPYTPVNGEASKECAVEADLVVGIATCDAKVPFLHVKLCTVEGAASGAGEKELLRLLRRKGAYTASTSK